MDKASLDHCLKCLAFHLLLQTLCVFSLVISQKLDDYRDVGVDLFTPVVCFSL